MSWLSGGGWDCLPEWSLSGAMELADGRASGVYDPAIADVYPVSAALHSEAVGWRAERIKQSHDAQEGQGSDRVIISC